MTKYKVVHQREECLGCGACAAVCPKFWEMAKDGKSKLKKAKETKPGIFELEIEEKDYPCHKEAEEVCPVQVIKIIKE